MFYIPVAEKLSPRRRIRATANPSMSAVATITNSANAKPARACELWKLHRYTGMVCLSNKEAKVNSPSTAAKIKEADMYSEDFKLGKITLKKNVIGPQPTL
jgi:hypothetical protein